MMQRLCGLKLSIFIIFVIIAIWSTRSVYSKDDISPSADSWSVEGRFINFTSLCDVPTPKLFPQTLIYPPGHFNHSVIGCKDKTLGEEYQQPLIIIIKIKNITKTVQSLILPLPSDLIVHTQAYSKPALALSYPVNVGRGLGEVQLWINNVDGKVQTDVKSGESIELSYLLSGFNGEATIDVLNIGKLKVNLLKQNIPSEIPSDVTVQIDKLRSQNSAERAEGAEQLGQMGDHAILATPYLIDILEDSTQVQKPIKEVDSAGNIFITGVELTTPKRIASEALNKITGRNFGEDVEKWKKWWKDNKTKIRKSDNKSVQ